MSRPFHVVIWGATGFTGRLVCEHVAQDYKGKINWAMAGRSQHKLEALRAELASRFGDQLANTPILVGSLDEPDSLDSITRQTSVIISTAGPFARVGTPVVAAAVRQETHYVDITGEVPWVHGLIRAYHEEAASKGVRIVNCCGFDSVPSDIGTLLVVEHMRSKWGVLPDRIVSAVVEGQGAVSGGTIATMFYNIANPGQGNKTTRTQATYPYALIPEREGVKPGTDTDYWLQVDPCPELGGWLAPFVMQVCNTRVVHRSNYLLGWGGPALHYREATLRSGWAAAKTLALATAAGLVAFSQSWMHPLFKKFLPAPGQGPTRDQMINGHFKQKVLGIGQRKKGTGAADNGEVAVVAEVGDPHRDPGYWSTSRMVLESALCLALEKAELDEDPKVLHGGVLTPASALGFRLVERLRGAGFTLDVHDVPRGG